MPVASFHPANKKNVKRNSTEVETIKAQNHYHTPMLKSPGGENIWSQMPQLCPSAHIIGGISGWSKTLL